ncbi:MAG: universal stress protein [Anaerolinea sp.]|nr:universal stress protein [Anaerolinea sp.]
MINTVLVPLDGSALAESALEHAVKIVKTEGKVILLTVLQTPEYPIYDFYPMTTAMTQSYDKTLNDAIPRAKEYLAGVAERISKQYGVLTSVYAEVGEPAEMIVKTAEKCHVDAICMSTHGRSGFSRWLFGSVTTKVLSVGVCPVYVIPTRQMEKHKTAEIASAKANGH